ncbi:MAG: tryptophan-rich sensory protein [Alphaproteobacteria bacterium]|nr:tryptophan-rich sensory protein [Alphaproteobacteria bacterium]MBV9373248.1 tryptophan-rich sensory protein [Alphaproteobacteria bacterium]MBV9901508.1 tryptophan-rich sensory protein [Alphaproteobacteria bacterium]
MTALASRSQLRMSFLRYALVAVPAILLLGTLSGRASGSGYGNAWFDALEKPSFMPPGWAFPVAWTLLYIALGLALALILHARGARGRGLALALFGAQLLLNFSWSPIFFAAHRVGAALVVILAILALSAASAFLFYRIRRAAGLLLIPYLAWLCFAAALNEEIARLNPNARSLVPGGASADIAL